MVHRALAPCWAEDTSGRACRNLHLDAAVRCPPARRSDRSEADRCGFPGVFPCGWRRAASLVEGHIRLSAGRLVTTDLFRNLSQILVRGFREVALALRFRQIGVLANPTA